MRIRLWFITLLLSVLILFAGCDFLLDLFPDSEQPAAAGDDSNALFGYPSKGSSRTQLIERDAYTLLFSYDDLTPVWVSWHIDGGDMGTGRKADFKGDPDVPDEYRLYKDDYTNSGFDRGHVCPNADRNNNDKEQQETFYMTNIVPQNPMNNQQTWQDLEEYLQGLAENNSEVYIIAGPAGVGGYDENGDYQEAIETTVDRKTVEITVPEYVWKVALIMNNDNNDLERAEEIGGCSPLAVIMPNRDTTDRHWSKYVCTIDDVEKLTGFDFFSELDDSVEADIESDLFEYASFGS